MPRRLRVKFPPSAARLLSALRGTFTLTGKAAVLTYSSLGVTPFSIVRTGAQYQTLQAAINAAVSGDTISGVPGTYVEKVSVTKSLTIKSSTVGQKVRLDASTIKGYGIFVCASDNITVVLEDFELYGNKLTDGNFYVGLYVVANGVNLTARRCKIHENGNGVASGQAYTSGSILLENCEIANNGEGLNGHYHDIYVDTIDSLTLRGCWVHNTNYRGNMPAGYEENSGHLVKSRSKALTVEASRLTMEIVYSPTWGANRCIDYPNGGDLTVRGNLIEYFTNQNGGVGQAISWGVEGANVVPGTTWDRSVWKVNIQQNTIVNRNASGRYWLWVGVGCSGDPTNNTNFSVVPAPTTFSVVDNVFCGWTSSPPNVLEGPSAVNSTTYATSLTTNTAGALTLLVDYANYDYRLVNSVAGSQNWATLQYAHPTSTITRSGVYRGSSGVSDGTTWVNAPSSYKGDQTFNALTAVKNSINATTGGWAQLSGTTLVSAAMTNDQLNAISPYAVLHANQYPNQLCSVWGSAAFNGYGFFVGAVGGHYAYWGNELYEVRVADPVGVHRLSDPAPIACVTADPSLPPGEHIVSPSLWSTISTDNVSGSHPAWGPRATHQYTGMVWDAATETVLMGGSNQNEVTNSTEIDAIAQYAHNVWSFNVNAATPKSAWSKVQVGTGANGLFSFVRNSDGTYSFRTFYGRFTINPATLSVVSGGGNGYAPKNDAYTAWRPCFRDPATNKYYEIHRTDLGNPYSNSPYYHSIFENVNGSLVKLCDLPLTYLGSVPYLGADADINGGVVVLNGYAYIWSSQSDVFRVNLSTGALTTFSDSTAIEQPVNGYYGTNGRWAYVPQAGCFVGISSENTNAYVFRPPASWGL